MKPDTLQAMSAVILLTGLFMAVVGAFGTFHFGRKVERANDEVHTALVYSLAERVASLQDEQKELRGLIANNDLRPAPASAEQPATAKTAAPAAAKPAEPAVVPDESFLDQQFVRLSPIAEGPAPRAESVKPQAGEIMSDSQRATLIKRLRGSRNHRLAIHAAAGDAHAKETALALRSAFREAGWEVGSVTPVDEAAAAPGLMISTAIFPPPEEVVEAFGALQSAGFAVSTDLDPNQSGQRAVLVVGPRR